MSRSEVREEFYSNILSDAAYAVTYWWEEHTDADFYDLTTRDVARGWQKLLEWERAGKFQHCNDDRTVRKADQALTSGSGDEDYDSCVADAVIQLAVIGDIVYG